jgi:hypothetical protein
VTDDNNHWPLHLRRIEPNTSLTGELDEEAADPPAHDHDQAELRAVERVVIELVRGASRGTRRRILAMLGELEAPR